MPNTRTKQEAKRKVTIQAGAGSKTVIRYLTFSSPLGAVLTAETADGICLVHFVGEKNEGTGDAKVMIERLFPGHTIRHAPGSRLLRSARDSMVEYFLNGVPLPHFPLDVRSGTSFQQEVWKTLLGIPFGKRCSYLDIARVIGRPRAPRAVGQACGANPVAVIIPCHRVVASGGKLGGYSGGLHIKRFLLDLEARDSDSHPGT